MTVFATVSLAILAFSTLFPETDTFSQSDLLQFRQLSNGKPC